MWAHLPHKMRSGRSGKRGFSSVVGAIFMVLIMWVLASNFFIYTLSQNTTYNNAVGQMNQLDASRLAENVAVSNLNYSVLGNVVSVEALLQNQGSTSVRVVTLWVLDTTIQNAGFNSTVACALGPGKSSLFSGSSAIRVTIAGVNSADAFNSWFVTARGNTVPPSWYANGGSSSTYINITGLTKIMGDFLPDYHSVQWAQLDTSTKQIGPWNTGWVLPSPTIAPGLMVVWRVNMTYYGINSIAFDNNTMLFFVPWAGKNKPQYNPWTLYIVNYTNALKINSYSNNQVVNPSPSGTPVTMYFAGSTIGATDGMSNDFSTYGDPNADGAMMSLTIYGTSPSIYAQSFPLFAISNGGQKFNAVLDHFGITTPSWTIAGISFGGVTVTAYDVWNNVITSYAGSVYFTATDPSAVVPYNATSMYTFVAGDGGVHTFSGFTLKTAGPQRISVTDGTNSAMSNAITVNPAASYALVYVSGGGQSVKVNSYSSGITVQRQDQYGNPTTSGSITVTLSTNSTTGNFYPRTNGNPPNMTSVTISDGSSSATFYYKDSSTGTPTLTASSSGLVQAVTTFTITP